jgi:hypothetical protein
MKALSIDTTHTPPLFSFYTTFNGVTPYPQVSYAKPTSMLRHTTAELRHTTTKLRLAQFVGVAYFSQKKVSPLTPHHSLQKAYGQIFNDDVTVYLSPQILASWIETRTVVNGHVCITGC